MTPEQQLSRVLHELSNHEFYLSATMRETVGQTVPVPRGYLARVVRNLRKLGMFVEDYDEPTPHEPNSTNDWWHYPQSTGGEGTAA